MTSLEVSADGRLLATGSADGTALVWPTLELILVESPRHLQRQFDEETGLALIRLQG